MSLSKIQEIVLDKDKFYDIQNYIDFAKIILEFLETNVQARIISQKENHYNFFQFKSDGNFNITRPINTNLFYSFSRVTEINKLEDLLKYSKDIKEDYALRYELCCGIYTIQQAIGITLDSLESGMSNTARKLNGDLFENLIRLTFNVMGVSCVSETTQVPIIDNTGKVLVKMSYQHDLVFKDESERINMLGSVKTSSKDRIDKIFIDHYLFQKITKKEIPYIAIFLNDVQRKNTTKENQYSINSTFLPGHFKGYTIALAPLDGVYYCDIRPNMIEDEFLKEHIKTIDYLYCEDIWNNR